MYHFLPWIMVSYTPICLHPWAEHGPPLIYYGEPGDKGFYLAVTRLWNAENAEWWGGERSHGPLQEENTYTGQNWILEVRLAFLFKVISEPSFFFFFFKYTCVMKPGEKLKTDSSLEMAAVLEISCPEWIRERDRVGRCLPPFNKQKCKYPRCLLHPPQG